MNRFVFVDLKRLTKTYTTRLVIILIPFVQATIVSVVLYCLNLNEKFIKRNLLFTIAKYSVLISAVIIIVGISYITFHLKCHKKNTFMELGNRCIIISIHSQTVFNKFKRVYYKKLYVINYKDLDCIRLIKGNIEIFGKINYYYDKSDNLRYTFDNQDQISFDNWWYNNNPSDNITYISINNYYSNCARSLSLARKLTIMEKAVQIKHKMYVENMKNMASDISRQKYRFVCSRSPYQKYRR